MRKIKLLAVALAVAMLMPMLMSCQAGKNKDNVVKADDPWFETTKFEMKKDIHQYEQVAEARICTSNDKVFTLYPLSQDKWGSARTVLDTYDFEGNLISRKELSCSEDCFFPCVYSISSDPEGTPAFSSKLTVILELFPSDVLMTLSRLVVSTIP